MKYMKPGIIRNISLSISLLLSISASGAELGTRQQTITPIALPTNTTPIMVSDLPLYSVYGYSSWQWGPGNDPGQQFDIMPTNYPGATNAAKLLTFFCFSDIHITDKESPSQSPWPGYQTLTGFESGSLPPSNGNSSCYSPVMLRTTQVLDAAVKTANNLNRLMSFDFGMSLGDNCNSSQYNELRWFIDVMDGKYIAPSSGAHLGATNIDYQKPFQAAGLDPSLPWYQVLGNHDHFWCGAAVYTDYLRQACTNNVVLLYGDLKTQGDDSRTAFMGTFDGSTPYGNIIGSGWVTNYIVDGVTNFTPVAPDTNRHSLTISTWMNEFFNTTSKPVGHGYSPANLTNGFACYSFVPKANLPLKIISLDDTLSDTNFNFNGQGALDDQHFNWLTNELQQGQDANQLMIIAAHIPIELIAVPEAPSIVSVSESNLVVALHHYPNLILWVTGHMHRNNIKAQPSPDTNSPEYGFWEIENPSLRDLPQEFRTYEILRNTDNSISIRVTDIDPDAPTNSQAYISRGFAVGASRIFANPSTNLTDTGSYTQNGELVKQLTTNMQAVIAHYGEPLGYQVAMDRIGTNEVVNFLGELQSANSRNGPWTDVTGDSPYVVPVSGAARFYRSIATPGYQPLSPLARKFQSFPPNLAKQITHVIVIYPENRSFDSLYGKFPGANGLANATNSLQYERSNGVPLANLIEPNTGNMPLISFGDDSRFAAHAPYPNAPFDTSPYVPDNYSIGDLLHAFYSEQYQINNPAYAWFASDPKNTGGASMSKFAVWSSNPGLVLSYYDEQNGGEGVLAKQFVLADNCFHSAFGCSYLNHQWLIAARTPIWPTNPPEGGQPTVANVASTPMDSASPAGFWWPEASAFDLGYGACISDSPVTPDPTLPGFPYSNANTNLTPGDVWAINTVEPLRGPAGGYLVPASGPYLGIPSPDYGTYPTADSNGTSVDMISAPMTSTPVNSRLPLQTYDTIGDRLNAAGVSWAWYAGGWNNAKSGRSDFLFQFHHQPFAYFKNYALKTSPDYPLNGSTNSPVPGVDSTDPTGLPVGYGIGSANHLLDEDADFYRMLDNGTLPQVSFVKPIGEDDSHPGYSSVKRSQAWVANIVGHIENSSIWSNTVVFICFDENGGLWDHVVPPVIDRWGPGTRIPFIIVSPWSKKGFVDHNQYETVSMLSFIEGLYKLPPLSTRDAAALPPVAAFSGQPDLFVEATVNQPVSYTIPAYNHPTLYTVIRGGFRGLVLNPFTGQITGTPHTKGSYRASIRVTGTESGRYPSRPNTIEYLVQVDVN